MVVRLGMIWTLDGEDEQVVAFVDFGLDVICLLGSFC